MKYSRTVSIHTSQDYHPYSCEGPGKCIHCDRKSTKYHRVGKCWLCHNGPPPGLKKTKARTRQNTP